MANYRLLATAVLVLFVLANLYQIVVIEIEVVGSTSDSSSSSSSSSRHGPPLDRSIFQRQVTESKVTKDEGKTSSQQQAVNKGTPGASTASSNAQGKDRNTYQHHAVAGLSCAKYGGPSDDAAREMVYWQDIPQDSEYVSPLKQPPEKYLTFEPDEGGWNNIRMGMETTVMLAISMGRTLVLPPEQNLYLLNQKGDKGQHKTTFGFHDFFHFRSIEKEHGDGRGGVRVLSFREFLEETAVKGKLRSATDNYASVVFPPGNRTNWDNLGKNFQASQGGGGKVLWPWMRTHMTDSGWNYDDCVAYFPASPNNNGEAGWKAMNEIDQEFQMKWKNKGGFGARTAAYVGNPTPVNGTVKARLTEMMANRKKICVYNTNLQNRNVIHFRGEQRTGQRMLVHFYAFLFFEDWKQDLWTKRFVRDHLRYIDEIQCAAARVVEAVRKVSKSRGDPTGSYDSMHVRRGDFQYKEMHMDAEFIYSNNTRLYFMEGRTVFVATDEKKRDYFEPLKPHYHLLFLNDFKEALGDVNTNFYGKSLPNMELCNHFIRPLNVKYPGMIDQLVASRGETFAGAYYSTFTGYINRIRGYHAQTKRDEGWEQGAIKSYYYTPFQLQRKRSVMRQYKSIEQGFWAQEFPIAWRDIDHDLDDSRSTSSSLSETRTS